MESFLPLCPKTLQLLTFVAMVMKMTNQWYKEQAGNDQNGRIKIVKAAATFIRDYN